MCYLYIIITKQRSSSEWESWGTSRSSTSCFHWMRSVRTLKWRKWSKATNWRQQIPSRTELLARRRKSQSNRTRWTLHRRSGRCWWGRVARWEWFWFYMSKCGRIGPSPLSSGRKRILLIVCTFVHFQWSTWSLHRDTRRNQGLLEWNR